MKLSFSRTILTGLISFTLVNSALAAQYYIITPIELTGTNSESNNPGNQESENGDEALDFDLRSAILVLLSPDTPYNFDFNPLIKTKKGTISSVTWSATGLPNGLEMSSSGQLSGTVSVIPSEVINITVTASANGKTVSQSYTLPVEGTIGWLSTNGVTVQCINAEEGTEFTVPERPDITYIVTNTKDSAKTHAEVACTSNITDMSHTFDGDVSFNGDISHWDTSNVTNMYAMLRGMKSFRGNISHWDTSNVTNMNYMFQYVYGFKGDLSTWDTSDLTTLKGFFYGAENLEVSLDGWDVSNVKDISDFFSNGVNLFVTANDWHLPQLKEAGHLLAYSNYVNATLNNWKLNGDLDLSYIANSSTAAVLTMNNWDFTQGVTGDSGTLNLNYGLQGAAGFQGDLKDWKLPSQVTMEKLFSFSVGASGNFDNWNVHVVGSTEDPTQSSCPDLSMNYFIQGAQGLQVNINTWDVKLSGNICSIFAYSEFNPKIDHWDVSEVTNMYSWFQNNRAFNQSLSSWDTGNVIDMSWMFSGANSFNQPLNGWDTSNLKGAVETFKEAFSFNQDIGAWDVSNVTNMSGMFLDSKSFDQNLSSWCVKNIPTYPKNWRGDPSFNEGTPASFREDPAKQPQWGTCPY